MENPVNTPYPAELIPEIQQIFRGYFYDFWKGRFELPNPLPLKGTLTDGNYTIEYGVFLDEGNLPSLDFFGSGPGEKDQHIRIRPNGEIIELPVFIDPVVNIIQVINKSHLNTASETEDYNNMVYDILVQKGFIVESGSMPESDDDEDEDEDW